MTITTIVGKGSELTHAEMDANFTDLRDGLNSTLPRTKGSGTKLGDSASKDFGWHDIVGNLFKDPDDANGLAYGVYKGGIKVRQFLPTTTDGLVSFHMPHDYAPGTAIHIHVHWSHNSTLVTGGSVTFGFELMYAQGHDQAAFGDNILVALIAPVNAAQYQHRIPETVLSSVGGSATTFDTNLLEPDGVVEGRIYLDSNDLTVSGGGQPDPFIHFFDVHYQSTGKATAQKSPDFYVA